jgi:hypothetical protein
VFTLADDSLPHDDRYIRLKLAGHSSLFISFEIPIMVRKRNAMPSMLNKLKMEAIEEVTEHSQSEADSASLVSKASVASNNGSARGRPRSSIPVPLEKAPMLPLKEKVGTLVLTADSAAAGCLPGNQSDGDMENDVNPAIELGSNGGGIDPPLPTIIQVTIDETQANEISNSISSDQVPHHRGEDAALSVDEPPAPLARTPSSVMNASLVSRIVGQMEDKQNNFPSQKSVPTRSVSTDSTSGVKVDNRKRISRRIKPNVQGSASSRNVSGTSPMTEIVADNEHPVVLSSSIHGAYPVLDPPERRSSSSVDPDPNFVSSDEQNTSNQLTLASIYSPAASLIDSDQTSADETARVTTTEQRLEAPSVGKAGEGTETKNISASKSENEEDLSMTGHTEKTTDDDESSDSQILVENEDSFKSLLGALSSQEVDDEGIVAYTISDQVSVQVAAPGSICNKEREVSTRLDNSSTHTGEGTDQSCMTDGSSSHGGETPQLFAFIDDDTSVLLSVEGDDELLSWRLDPDVSLSDWTVCVTNTSDGTVHTYHLHKNILAVGPRKSEYFASVFRSRGRAGDSITEISLAAAACRAIPQLLDFVYSHHGQLDITANSATGLRYLAKMFGIRILHKQVTEFIQRDLSLSNVLIYYRDAFALGDEKVTTWTARHCARNIMKIDPHNSILVNMDTKFFLRVLQNTESPEGNSTNNRTALALRQRHYHSSILVASYCRLNKNALDETSFRLLTDEGVLPLIDYSVALMLLELEADVSPVGTSVLKFSEITSLQKRCIKELAHHWRDLADMDRDNVVRVCRKLSPGVLTELLIRSLSKAAKKLQTAASKAPPSERDEYPERPLDFTSSSNKDPAALESDIRQEYETKLREEREKHYEDMAKLKKEYETNLGKLRDICLDKDKRIAEYWQELQSFERLPNNSDGKVLASGIMNKASKIPIHCKASKEGQLYVVKQASQEGGTAKKYPLFYFKSDSPT